MKATVFIHVVWLWMILSESAHSGAWVQEPGKGLIISTNIYSTADTAFDENGDAVVDSDFEKLETQIYGEYGLTKGLTLIGSALYQDVEFSAGEGQEQFSGFGNSEIGLRYRLWSNERNVISIQSSVIFPGGGETIADADLGVGGISGEVRALYGHSFGDKAFANIEAAWRYQGDRTPQSYRLEASAGYRPIPPVQVMGQVYYTSQERERELSRQVSAVKAQLSLSLDHKSATYQIGTYRTVAGETIVQESAIFLGVWKRF